MKLNESSSARCYHQKVFIYVIYIDAKDGLIMNLMLYMVLMLASTIAIASGEDYSHRYDTFEISFSTPSQITANVQWGSEKPGMKILMDLSTGESPFVFRHILTTWNSRSSTNANLEKLWTTYASGRGYTTPTISKLDNGDFLVTGRMIVLNRGYSKFTRTMRTFDFNSDGLLDFIVFWNGNGYFDTNILNYLASTTKVSPIESKESQTASSADQIGKRKLSRVRSQVTATQPGWMALHYRNSHSFILQ